MKDSIRFLDTDGFAWEVRQVDTSGSAGAATFGRGHRWLYFFSRFATRKLADYPADWSTRRWWELEALCDKAISVATAPERFERLERLRAETQLRG